MITIKDMKMPESCSECELCEHITWWSKEKITASFDCALLGVEKHSKDSKKSWSSPRHPQCPLSDTTITSEEVRGDLKYISCYLAETADTEFINIKQYISSLESKLTPQLDSDVEEDLNNLFKWDSDLKVSFIKIGHQELVLKIKQHISNQQNTLDKVKEMEQAFRNDAEKQPLSMTAVYILTILDKLQELLKEVK